MSGLELVGTVLAVAMVLCNLRVHPAAWPLAIASSAAYGLLFHRSQLYGQALLQGVFIAVAAWGWRQWLRGTEADGSALVVRWLPWRQRAMVLAATLAAWPALALLLGRTTDNPAPWLDGLTTVASITGQLLLARKRADNWPVWLAVNLASVLLFVSQGLWLTAAVYGLFAALAVAGWRHWARLASAGAAARPVQA